MGYDRIVYIRYHFSCGLDRKDACWLSFTPLTGILYLYIYIYNSEPAELLFSSKCQEVDANIAAGASSEVAKESGVCHLEVHMFFS